MMVVPTATKPPQASTWLKYFNFQHVKPLIICRGPVRLEAIEAFEAMGTQAAGMLLSEKDSVMYPRALAPELRQLGLHSGRVHRIPDYMANHEGQKHACIERILTIARQHRYTHIFAGYGFMAEDPALIEGIENAGLVFIGPRSTVARAAGVKDNAKSLARNLSISICPGVDDVAARALLRQLEGEQGLKKAMKRLGLQVPPSLAHAQVHERAAWLEEASRSVGKSLLKDESLYAEAVLQAKHLFARNPGRRLRLKHVGGGGGKGQRIITQTQQAAAAVQEILREAQATGPQDNKRFLIELNVETTRHNEIQLLGNGEWCIALGGRDCSIQMHEQKLLEFALSEENLLREAKQLEAQNQPSQAKALQQQAHILQRMEREAERFGQAVGLNSVSTFECIVEGSAHYFMEMNTRIQVEHRVSEQIYALQFANPKQPEEHFEVSSLVQAMLWVAVYGKELPKPTRIPKHHDGLEVRLNASNDALGPHGGGELHAWSAAAPWELRDDQGLGLRHPDNAKFTPYRIAGAYDSNLALLVTHGDSRVQTYAHMVAALRRMSLQGEDLQSNHHFHQGLMGWLMGAEPWALPQTDFTQAWLAGVGALAQQAALLDLDALWEEGLKRTRHGLGAQAADILAQKRSLLLRPLAKLFSQPHLLAGWCAPHPLGWLTPWFEQANQTEENPTKATATVFFAEFYPRQPQVLAAFLKHGPQFYAHCPKSQNAPRNLTELAALYFWLHLENRQGASAEECIWEHDAHLLSEGLTFYSQTASTLNSAHFANLTQHLQQSKQQGNGAQTRLSSIQWAATQAAHRGHQLGLEWLRLPWLLAQKCGFSAFGVTENLCIKIPTAFEDAGSQVSLRQALVKAPQSASDTVVAWTGGVFYMRPAPNQPPYVTPGQHVQTGDVLGLLEVMKMFNPIYAKCDGVVKSIGQQATGTPLADGNSVSKGQRLFGIEPDTTHNIETPEKRAKKISHATEQWADTLWPF